MTSGFGTYCPLHDWEMEGRECICDTRLTKPVKSVKMRYYRLLTSWTKEVIEVGEEFSAEILFEKLTIFDFSTRSPVSRKNETHLPGKQKLSQALKKHPDFTYRYSPQKKLWYRRIR